MCWRSHERLLIKILEQQLNCSALLWQRAARIKLNSIGRKDVNSSFGIFGRETLGQTVCGEHFSENLSGEKALNSGYSSLKSPYYKEFSPNNDLAVWKTPIRKQLEGSRLRRIFTEAARIRCSKEMNFEKVFFACETSRLALFGNARSDQNQLKCNCQLISLSSQCSELFKVLKVQLCSFDGFRYSVCVFESILGFYFEFQFRILLRIVWLETIGDTRERERERL